MKNIILQHWSGGMIELTELSSTNIAKYAKKIGADYKLLRGDVFRPHLKLSAPCHKLHMLDKVFDEYDMVVMLDADMFTRKGMEENVFTDVVGIGRHTEVQDRLVRSLVNKFPKLGNLNYPFWGGSIYRLDLELRQQLRNYIRDEEIINFSRNVSYYQDEGIMHRLAVLAEVAMENAYLPGNHWNCGSFETGVENSAIIHIRTKVAPNGPKKPKIENYRDLVKRGLIEE